MNGTEMFIVYKPLLFAVAYRILGVATDADDIVQDAFADLTKSGIAVEDGRLKAYLCRIVANKCKDRIKALMQERERYPGLWLPEPVPTVADEPVLLRETLAFAFLLLLQDLSETERHVFVLRTVGEFSYKDIGWMLEKSEANCRQIYRRAKTALERRQDAAADDRDPHRSRLLIERFVNALQNGRLDELVEVLADDVAFAADSGGKAVGAPAPIRTSERVSQFLMKTSSLVPAGMRTDFAQLNGCWGLVLSAGPDILYVFAFRIKDDRIRNIYAISNPDKLIYAGKLLRHGQEKEERQ